MTKNFDINRLRIASPCTAGWESMSGDNKARHCGLCELSVYNTSEMTAAEVKALLIGADGRACIRLYRRADGTVITKDCAVGVRSYRKRMAKYYGAALAAILGLFSFSSAQTKEQDQCQSSVTVIKKSVKKVENTINGKVTDAGGKGVAKLWITLVSANGFERSVTTDDEGVFVFANMTPGTYSVRVPGEEKVSEALKDIEIGKKEGIDLDIKLESTIIQANGIETVTMGTAAVIITTRVRGRIQDLPIN